MNEYQLLDNVTRWLDHEGYTHTKEKNDDASFQIKIDNFYGVHIFEPKKQKGVLVVGIKIRIPSNINKFYKKSYDENDKINFISNIEKYAKSIGAVYKFYDEIDEIKSGVYIVLDSKEKLNLTSFKESLFKIVEMGDSMRQFLDDAKGTKGAGNGKPSQSNYFTRMGDCSFKTFLNRKMNESNS